MQIHGTCQSENKQYTIEAEICAKTKITIIKVDNEHYEQIYIPNSISAVFIVHKVREHSKNVIE